MVIIGDSILSRTSNVNKAYVDHQDSLKVDKEVGKALSSNDFTDDYRSKIDHAIQGITSSGESVEMQNGVVNLTPEVLKCLASGVIQRTNDGPTYFLRILKRRGDFLTKVSAPLLRRKRFKNAFFRKNCTFSHKKYYVKYQPFLQFYGFIFLTLYT